MGRGEEGKEGKGRDVVAGSKKQRAFGRAPEANVIVYCHVKVVCAFLGFRV